MSSSNAPRRISLALTLHNHQPVGNFGWVFDEIYERAYLPMIEALERHPKVRLSLHYTGPLLEWFAAAHPEFLARVRALVERGQVEIVGGGLYEPILASLPAADRVAQLQRMRDRIKELVGVAPQGAWLAERVWEPSLPAALHDGGYRWTILDDAHFRAAAIPEDALWGAYLTEDEGKPLTVFGTEQGLRYRIPFGSVESVIEYLREHATPEGERIGTMGDDGEKFGSWPTTWDHCWGDGQWVEKFFTALEKNADWLTTPTPSRWLDERGPIGRVYLPTSSYAEMGDWVLPAEESQIFGPMLHAAQDAKSPEARYLRGGFWRNFQVKYTEINDLHKQMLRTSAKVAAMPAGPEKLAAEDHLHRGQSNDCYWHGLFGGVYITHMRLATFEHLIAAEDIADATYRRTSAGASLPALLTDLDLDGSDELQLANAGARLQIDPAEGGAITSFDLRAPHHALLAVMRRRPEAYHEKLRAHAAAEEASAHDCEERMVWCAKIERGDCTTFGGVDLQSCACVGEL
ncbi:MAG: alpha-amylase/4-alpha-glucanotransferase domain-containing protein, partial [Candidatus Limnocylindrus sp.]